MADLSDDLETITVAFWETWRQWRHGAGWRYGPDNQAACLSPYLLDNFADIPEDGKVWFRQHAALVLHAVDVVRGLPKPKKAKAAKEETEVEPAEQVKPTAPATPQEARERAVRKLKSALQAMLSRDAEVSFKKLRAALKLLPDDKEHEQVRHFVRVAIKNLDILAVQGQEPKRSLHSTKAALKYLGTTPLIMIETKPVKVKNEAETHLEASKVAQEQQRVIAPPRVQKIRGKGGRLTIRH